MRDQTREKTGSEPAEMCGVVDSGIAEAEEDIESGPEQELLKQTARPAFVSPSRRAADRDDECSQDPEDRAAGSGSDRPGEEYARKGGYDSGHRVSDDESFRAEHHLEQSSQLVERPAVEQEVEQSDVKKHGGDESPPLSGLGDIRNDCSGVEQSDQVALASDADDRDAVIDLPGKADQDQNQNQSRCWRTSFQDPLLSRMAETFRISQWAGRGASSLNRMNRAAVVGTMVR